MPLMECNFMPERGRLFRLGRFVCGWLVKGACLDVFDRHQAALLAASDAIADAKLNQSNAMAKLAEVTGILKPEASA
jgi:hypothetical protein